MTRIDLYKSKARRQYLEAEGDGFVFLVEESRKALGWNVTRIRVDQGMLTRALVDLNKVDPNA